jgi:SnoaL-like domain
VIKQYVSGLESQNLAALKRVRPSLGGREERAIRTEFENARVVQTVFKDPRITINGDTTTVTGFRMHSLVTLDGQRLSSVTKTTMTLRRTGDVWTIERIVHQQ